MTEAEFTDWQNYHASMFPKFGDWMLGMGGGGEGQEPQEIAQLRGQQWFDALVGFSGDDVKAASFALRKMPDSERPRYYSDHISALLEILRRPKSRQELARRRVNCELCRDTGMVTATAKPGYAIFSNRGLPMPHGIYASVACVCERGIRYPAEYMGPKLADFDGVQMQPWRPDLPEPHERLERMARGGDVAARLAHKLGNFMRLPAQIAQVVDQRFIEEMEAIED